MNLLAHDAFWYVANSIANELGNDSFFVNQLHKHAQANYYKTQEPLPSPSPPKKILQIKK